MAGYPVFNIYPEDILFHNLLSQPLNNPQKHCIYFNQHCHQLKLHSIDQLNDLLNYLLITIPLIGNFNLVLSVKLIPLSIPL